MSDNLVITIGREHGSGGRYIGEKLAEKLGIKCYNSEIVTETALKSGFSENFIADNEEKKPESLLFSIAMAYSVSGSQPITMRLFNEQTKVIKELAQREPCIIIGRAADYILRDHKNLLRVFVCAPLEDRISRICRTDKVDANEAEKLIRKKDKQRAAFISFYSDRKWGLASNYDLCINTALFGIDGAVDVLASCAKERLK
jgi:cytidylate kinase